MALLELSRLGEPHQQYFHCHFPWLFQLPIGELKRRLAARGIDSSACLEKSELVELLRQVARSKSPRKPVRERAGAHKGWAHARQRDAVQRGFALAENYVAEDDLRGFLAMEKYDGIRASWEPAAGNFRTRTGWSIQPAPSLLKLLPTDTRLDGELWAGDASGAPWNPTPLLCDPT